MSVNTNNTPISVIVYKKETMDKRDLARLLDYYRMRVGMDLKLLFSILIN
jgi:hypothetical protein